MESEMCSTDENERLRSSRSIEDINSILEFAKLDPTDLRPCVQCLSFSNELENDSIKLLELEQPVLEALTSGQRVEIRGSSNESAVLVTDSLTFDLREAETSNSMLMLPYVAYGQDLPTVGDMKMKYGEVTSVVHSYYELRLIKPKLNKMRSLLELNMYRGRECEGDEFDTEKKYTLAELQDCIQASDKEILVGLKKCNACEIEGHWRLLDFEYLSTVLYHILQLCEERDWLTTGVDVSECCQVLQELFPRIIVEHLIHCFSSNGSCQDSGETNSRVLLCEDKVCKHFAELCLRNSGKFNLHDFLQAWQGSVPGGMNTSLTQIEGMALVDKEAHPQVIWYYPVEDLPEGVSERFEVLFEERKKWTLDEITPYIRDMTDLKTDVGSLLTRYARASLQKGIKVFSSRTNL